MTRNALKLTVNTTPQPRLWQEGTGCSASNNSQTEQCVLGTSTLGKLSELSNPYLAGLPIGFNTGLIKQFIPRINSSVKWEPISPELMPVNCSGIPDSFYALYANATTYESLSGPVPRNWSIEICMPANQSESPWSDTYERQDFSEELFLNISVMGYDDDSSYSEQDIDSPSTGGMFRVTSNTTAGYFELPNYMNGGQAGLIIDGDPDDSDHCGFDCRPQVYFRTPVTPRDAPPLSNFQTGGPSSLSTVSNKGVRFLGSSNVSYLLADRTLQPLLTVAVALFGYNSFIHSGLSHQEAFNRQQDRRPQIDYAIACVGERPFASLLLGPDDSYPRDCDRDPLYAGTLDEQLAGYVRSFYTSPETEYLQRLTNAFSSAVFLATEAWLTFESDFRSRRVVHSDPGADLVIPAMSRAAMILISSLWTIYIACLFSLAIYSARVPRWTNTLDAFAMMRVGAAMDDRISLKVGFEGSTIGALDELTGVIGDTTGGEGDIGALGIGASTPLNGLRPYECYEGDAVKAFRTRTRAHCRNPPIDVRGGSGRFGLPGHYDGVLGRAQM